MDILNMSKGLKQEAKAFARLASGEISKNLVQLFFSHELLKKQGSNIKVKSTTEIKDASVIGAGLMGSGIAWLMSSRGVNVRLKDVNWPAIGAGLFRIKQMYMPLLKRRKLDKRELGLALHRVTGAVEDKGLAKSNIVIEAIVEDMDVKKRVFQSMEAQLPDTAILASNTSSLSVTEMAKVLTRPENFLGIHFFSPVNRMPLVEIIPGEKTSDATVKTAVDFIKRMGKTPVIVKNCPGFLVNRVLIPYVNEAVYCLQDGADTKRIDTVMENYGMPLGPLSLADEVGLDVGYKVAKVLEEGYGERMKVSDSFEAIHVETDLLGKKAKKGFYIYSKSEKQANKVIKNLVQPYQNWVGAKLTDEDLILRMVLIMVNEAARCLEESVVESPEILDMAMIMGTGFPPFRGGLLKYADSLGISNVLAKLKDFETVFGSRFSPAPLLEKMAKEGSVFYK